MKTQKHVTITSKNQVTIPADFVKILNIHQDRTMSAVLRDGSIVLTPTQDLSDDMQKFWAKRNQKVTLSDDELKQATKKSATKRLTK